MQDLTAGCFHLTARVRQRDNLSTSRSSSSVGFSSAVRGLTLNGVSRVPMDIEKLAGMGPGFTIFSLCTVSCSKHHVFSSAVNLPVISPCYPLLAQRVPWQEPALKLVIHPMSSSAGCAHQRLYTASSVSMHLPGHVASRKSDWAILQLHIKRQYAARIRNLSLPTADNMGDHNHTLRTGTVPKAISVPAALGCPVADCAMRVAPMDIAPIITFCGCGSGVPTICRGKHHQAEQDLCSMLPSAIFGAILSHILAS